MAARKKLFVALLGEDQALSDAIGKTAAQYQIETSGIVWKEEPGKPIWGEVAAMILKNSCDGWLVAGKQADWLANAEMRSHISLGVLKAVSLIGPNFTLFRMIDPDVETLPFALADSLAVDKAKLGPRLAAKLGTKSRNAPVAEYRLDLHPLPVGDGFVAEIGPPPGAEWQGALFASRGAGEISHHTVGPRGAPPGSGIVEYAMKGLKLEIGGEEYTGTGWAVKNRLDAETSYYVRLVGETTGFVFGQLPESDAGDLYAITLI